MGDIGYVFEIGVGASVLFVITGFAGCFGIFVGPEG